MAIQLRGVTESPTPSDPLEVEIDLLRRAYADARANWLAVIAGAKQTRDQSGFTVLFESPAVYRTQMLEIARDIKAKELQRAGVKPVAWKAA